jgi:disulfide bond formation protein DsbB
MNPALLPFYVLTLLGLVVVLKLLFIGLFPNLRTTKWAYGFVQNNALQLVLLVAGVAMAGSLTFSEVLLFEPCKLCWWQRIAMYPQVLLAGIGINNKDKRILEYIGALSAIGLVIALVHYYVQMTGFQTSCSLTSFLSCSQTPFKGFGFITIPTMAATAFAINLLIVWIAKKR